MSSFQINSNGIQGTLPNPAQAHQTPVAASCAFKLFRSNFRTSSVTFSTHLRLSEDDSEMFENIGKRDAGQGKIMDELAWRSKKVQLEEAEAIRFQKRLKSKPWKIPYEDARKWVQANLGPSTKEEFFDLVENGNLRSPYIPKQPEKYYSEKGTWISWEHFLVRTPPKSTN